MRRSILGFDTSVINALHKDGASAEPLLAGLSAGYAIRLNGTTLEEVEETHKATLLLALDETNSRCLETSVFESENVLDEMTGMDREDQSGTI